MLQQLRFSKAMKMMEVRARVPLFLTYRAVGSSTGQKEFVGDAASMFLGRRKQNEMMPAIHLACISVPLPCGV